MAYDPTLINALTPFFQRRGTPLDVSAIPNNSLSRAKLDFSVPTTGDIEALEASIKSLQSSGSSTSGSVSNLQTSVSNLQTSLTTATGRIEDLENLLTTATGRIEDLENLLAAAVLTDSVQFVDESTPTDRIILTITDGLITDVTREEI